VKKIATLYLVVASICAVIQLVLGANFPILLALYIISVCGFFSIYSERLSVASLIYFSICLYSGFFAILIKTVLWQPVQQNLYDPDTSAIIVFTGHMATTAAYLVAQKFPIRLRSIQNLKQEFDTVGARTPLFLIMFAIAFILLVLHEQFRPQFVNGNSDAIGGFGGFGAFYFLLVFSFAGQVSRAVSSNTRGSDTMIASVMFVMITGLSFAGNVKKDVLDAALVVGLIFIFYRLKMKPRYIVAGVVFLFLTQFVISPLIHVTRAEQTHKTISERVDLTMAILKQNNYDLARINALSDKVYKGFTSNYRASGSYVYPSTANIDRFALILPVDQVARVQDPGRVTPEEVTDLVAQRVLPSALVSKSPGVLADIVSWKYGFRTYLTVGRPVVGLSASSYAVGGLPAVIGISFFLMLVVFLVLDLIGGAMTASPWSVAMVVNWSYLAEKEIDAFIGILLRDIPLMMVTLAIFVMMARLAYPARGASSQGGAPAYPVPRFR
jgi:hypothetical protein